MKLYLSPKAHFQYQCLKGKSVPYANQVKAIMLDIREHPLSGIGSPVPFGPADGGWWERRFNGSGMLVYRYEEGEDYVVITSIANDLLPSHEELPIKLQAMSRQDYAQVIRQMEANRGEMTDYTEPINW